jgi:hypothetical protein
VSETASAGTGEKHARYSNTIYVWHDGVYPEFEVALFRYRNGGSLLALSRRDLEDNTLSSWIFLDRCEWKNEEDAATNLSG